MAHILGMGKRNQYDCKKWRNKSQYTHSMEYYRAIKRKEPLMLRKTKMDLKDITLSERSQTSKKHLLDDCIYIMF